MRKIRLVFLALVAIASAFLSSCGYTEQIEQLQTSLDSAKLDANEKNALIEEFFRSMDQIEANLAHVKAQEAEVGQTVQNVQNGEMTTDVRSRIQSQIVEINTYMEANRRHLASLTERLKKSDVKVKQFENMIATAQARMNESDSTILNLKTRLETLQFSLDSMNVVVDTLMLQNETLTTTLAERDAKLDEAFYAVGTLKELQTNSVVDREGGFLGMGRRTELSGKLNTDYFTKIAKATTEEIPLGSTKKGVQIVTNHPDGSYELIKDEKGAVTSLRILDWHAFWRTSNYLVVVLK